MTPAVITPNAAPTPYLVPRRLPVATPIMIAATMVTSPAISVMKTSDFKKTKTAEVFRPRPPLCLVELLRRAQMILNVVLADLHA